MSYFCKECHEVIDNIFNYGDNDVNPQDNTLHEYIECPECGSDYVVYMGTLSFKDFKHFLNIVSIEDRMHSAKLALFQALLHLKTRGEIIATKKVFLNKSVLDTSNYWYDIFSEADNASLKNIAEILLRYIKLFSLK